MRDDGLATGPVVDSVGYGTELARATRARTLSLDPLIGFRCPWRLVVGAGDAALW
jgi:hypothetical protein